MPTIQYTIRGIPKALDYYLRERSRLSGKSLNQIVIEELLEKVAPAEAPVATALDWFIGKGMEKETLEALEEEDRTQKKIAQKELLHDS